VTKIFLTGANGLLGSSFKRIFTNRNSYNVKSLAFKEIESLNSEQLKNILNDIDWIIHCAALTNVEYCEKNPEDCYKANCLFTEKLSLCANKHSRFLFISSTGIYGEHKSTPYNEFDKVEPTTVHHKSKEIAEKIILNHNPENIIVRTGWLYGDISKNDFVSKIINEAELASSPLKSNSDQIGCPTNSNELSKVCIDLINKDASGIFNVTSSGEASRFDYVKTIIEIFGYETNVLPVKASFFDRIAKVSNNETAISVRLKDFGIDLLPNWKISLKKYLKKLKSQKRKL